VEGYGIESPLVLPAASARSRVVTLSGVMSAEPLSTMALWKSPLAGGNVSSDSVFVPPPDSPKIKTLLGSPPAAAPRRECL